MLSRVNILGGLERDPTPFVWRRWRTMTNFKDKRALVVDDEPDVIDYMSLILENNGFDIYSAGNGKEVMEKVKE